MIFKEYLNEQKFEHMDCYDDPSELYYCIPEAMKSLKLVKDSEVKRVLSKVNAKSLTMCITNTSFNKDYMTEQGISVNDLTVDRIKKFFNKEKPTYSRDDYPVLTICPRQREFNDNYKVKNSVLCYDGYKFFTPVI